MSDVSRNICHLCSPEQRHTINGNDQLLRALCLWTTITCVSPNTLQSPHPRLTRRHLCLACDASSSLNILVSQHLDAATMIVDAPKNRHTVRWKRRQDGQQLLARSSSGATNAGSRTAALTSCCYNSFVASLVPLSTTPSSRITAYSTSLIDTRCFEENAFPLYLADLHELRSHYLKPRSSEIITLKHYETETLEPFVPKSRVST